MTEVPPGSGPVDGLRPGSRIREWRVERFLARGAFGQVFAATRDSWGDEPTRALKVFDPILSSAARSGLVNEFELLRGVRDPHLLAGEDAFDIDEGPLAGCVVFVMELADVDLASEAARRGPLPVGEVADVGAQLAVGLAALHDGGHLHGDVKPENALRADGSWKLGDFGVSSSLQGSYAHPIGATLDFRPPEVAEPGAAGRVHRSADVWALGTTLWLVASGRHPFVGADAAVRHAAVLRGERQEAPDLDLALADLIDRRCLVVDPHRRATAAELAVELRQLAGLRGAPVRGAPTIPVEGVGPAPPTGPGRADPTTARDAPGTTRPAPAPAPDPPDRVPVGSAPMEGGALAAPLQAPLAGAAGEAPPVEASRRVGPAAAQCLIVGAVAGGVVTEVASLVASVAPGGLTVRRGVHLLLTVVALGGLAVVLGPRLRRRLAAPALPAAVVGALVVAVAVTAFLFSGP